MPTRVAILVFDDAEVLDVCGPFEVFSVASRLALAADPSTDAPFEVVLVSTGPALLVTARGGLRITADHRLPDAPPADIVMVPGGITTDVENDDAVLAWLRASTTSAQVVSSVCNGALVLAQAGLLDGHTATTHWADIDELRERFPDVTVIDDGVRYIDHGSIATSAGVSAGIDLALHLVARFSCTEAAIATARRMDYPCTLPEIA